MKRTIHQRLAKYIQLSAPGVPWDADQLLSLCTHPHEAAPAYRSLCWVWAGPMSLPAPKSYHRSMVANRKRYDVVQTQKPFPCITVEGRLYPAHRLVFDTVRGHYLPPEQRLQRNHL